MARTTGAKLTGAERVSAMVRDVRSAQAAKRIRAIQQTHFSSCIQIRNRSSGGAPLSGDILGRIEDASNAGLRLLTLRFVHQD